MNTFKILAMAAIAAHATPVRAECEETLLQRSAEVAAKLSHSMYEDAFFVYRDASGTCGSTAFISSRDFGGVDAKVKLPKGSTALFFVHTHPNPNRSSEQRYLSDEDVSFISVLSSRLGHRVVPGVVTEERRTGVFSLYLFDERFRISREQQVYSRHQPKRSTQ